MVCEDVLKVKNLPKDLTDTEKEEFLKYFGATKVKIITSKSHQKSTAYARFETKEAAREVLFRLHQTHVLKNRLCVEYSDQDVGLPRVRSRAEPLATPDNNLNFRAFVDRVGAFNHCVGFDQPPPAHLRYRYPAANRPTVNNIGHALATVPRFYAQVLHLMNRMHLPPPFALDAKPPPPPRSESESELESSGDEARPSAPAPRAPAGRGLKRPKFIRPQAAAPAKAARAEDAFERVALGAARRIELRVSGSLPAAENGGEPPGEAAPAERAEEARAGAISLEELAENQIPARDLDVLAVFKNYHPGVPTSRLYVKNIAKGVELKDLEFVYNRYKGEGGEGSCFEVRLMQEGRMKGQAFVTLDSIEVAQRALNETNAFILKDKPLVVVFARNVSKKQL